MSKYISILIFLKILVLNMLFSQSVWSSTYSFQEGVNGYNSFHDVIAISSSPSGSFGEVLFCRDGRIGLLRFDSLGIPPGLYQFELTLSVNTVQTAADLLVYELLKRDWTDPGATLSPPATSSTYPTWSHQNYNSITWEIAGASGSADRGDLLSTRYIDSALDYTFTGTVQIGAGQNDLAFILQTTGDIELHYSEQGVTANNPKLVLTPASAKPPGGLNWSAVFHFWRSFFLR